jgi:hypothetical protein
MYVVKRQKANGGFNVKRRKGGGVPRLVGMKTEGLGKAQTTDFYEKTNVSHPFKSLGSHNLRTMETVKLKTTKPKKYISLNV